MYRKAPTYLGITIGKAPRTDQSLLKGRSVRTVSHAIGNEIKIDTPTTATVNTKVLNKVCRVLTRNSNCHARSDASKARTIKYTNGSIIAAAIKIQGISIETGKWPIPFLTVNNKA